jgi:CPA2 family monovalent cation:H+ antiporter-2
VEHLSHTSIDVVIYLLAAVLISLFCKKIKISSVLGYLVVGVVLGPKIFCAINDIDTAKSVGEFGVVFLLFTIGLELPFERLRELKRYVFGLGTAQVLLSCAFFAVFFIVYFNTGLKTSIPIETAILIGSGLALSSTAVVLQVLGDSGELSSHHGRVTFSVLLFQDLVVVVLLVWLTLLQQRGHDVSVWAALGYAILRAAGVFLGFAVLGRYLLRPIYRTIAATGSSELFMAMTLLVVLSTSMATQMAGLSLELGAFLAGLLLAETEYRHQVEADIKPYRSLLLGLFFMTVGMSINPHLITEFPREVFIPLGVLITAKFIIIVFLSRFMQLPLKSCMRIGFLLAGGGEFVFVLFAQAEKAKVITAKLSEPISLAVVISMALTPLFAWFGRSISRKMTRDIGVAKRAAENDTPGMRDHIIIVGAGRVGLTVHRLLSDTSYSSGPIPHVMIDMDMKRVNEGRDKQLPVYFGDGRRMDLFRALNIERARAVVITTNIFNTSFRIATELKRLFPQIEVFVRVADSNEAYRLYAIGARPVAPELLAPSFQLASSVLELCHVPTEQIEMAIEKCRKRQIREEEGSDSPLPPWLKKKPAVVESEDINPF